MARIKSYLEVMPLPPAVDDFPPVLHARIVYEKVVYDAPKVIMERLDQVNLDIAAKMEELRGLLGE